METKNIKNINVLIQACLDGKAIKILSDVYDKQNNIVIKENTIIEKAYTLKKIKKNNILGINATVINKSDIPKIEEPKKNTKDEEFKHYNIVQDEKIEKRFDEIKHKNREAKVKVQAAKQNIKKVLETIKTKNGRFNYSDIENSVEELVTFIDDTNNSFAYLSKEIFSYDNYLYNHSTNVCTIGLTILKKLNENNKTKVNKKFSYVQKIKRAEETNLIKYTKDEINKIAKGFFMHDIGKVLLPDKLLNKPAKLTPEEFEEVKKHSYVNGLKLLKKNKIEEPFIQNSVIYHHAQLHPSETGCYPIDKKPSTIPPYVFICKIADLYDALTSKRCYKEAISPLLVVAQIFRAYANKGNNIFQNVLLSFVNTIGIYPPNSILYLTNGQKAYVIDSNGPTVIPFTDTKGNTLKNAQEPQRIEPSDIDNNSLEYNEDIFTPIKIYDSLPQYLKKFYKDSKLN